MSPYSNSNSTFFATFSSSFNCPLLTIRKSFFFQIESVHRNGSTTYFGRSSSLCSSVSFVHSLNPLTKSTYTTISDRSSMIWEVSWFFAHTFSQVYLCYMCTFLHVMPINSNALNGKKRLVNVELKCWRANAIFSEIYLVKLNWVGWASDSKRDIVWALDAMLS